MENKAMNTSAKLYTEAECFPDGTPIDSWFYDCAIPQPEQLGRPYCLTQYGILDDGRLYTAQIQALIDEAAAAGGGCIVVPAGTYRTGALYFRQGVNLYIMAGGTLKGSDDIADYPLCDTRIEGQSCRYFPALINAEGLDGFTILGPGTIDGSGLRAWQAFWLRRAWNPGCTNKDEQRARLVFLSNCRNAVLAGITLQNAQFWTTHLYRCDHVKYLGCRIFSPGEPLNAPSTDAIDLDACQDILIKNCHMAVNDDAIALKGGKGLHADTQPENGGNERVLIEDCTFGFCHACLTCGSESIHNRNILMRRVRFDGPRVGLCLKMRPDTPQHYEYITVEEASGRVQALLNINPWTQFAPPEAQISHPNRAEKITIRNCTLTCETAFQVHADPARYTLSDFTLKNLTLSAAQFGTLEGISDSAQENVQATIRAQG